MATIRILEPGDEALVERFCARYPDTTLFFRSNVLVAGLKDRGERRQGTYAAAIEAEEIVALVSHVWLGNILLEAPVHLASVVRAAVRHSGRPVEGVVGPHAQVAACREALGLAKASVKMDSKEDLFSLDLAALQVPAALSDGGLTARHPVETDVPLLVAWRADYAVEALHDTDGPALRAQFEKQLRNPAVWADQWLLEERGRPVSFTAFNARTPDSVQIGGVWTPPAERSKGYARAAVAASLLEARSGGVQRSILFTDTENYAAQACYRHLGYALVGDYAILLFEDEHRPTE